MSLSIQALITRLEYRLGWIDDSAHRAKALDFLNDSERYISTRGSWLYLRRKQTFVLANTLSSLAAPSNPAMDPGNQVVISDDIGKLTYLSPDDFPGLPASDFYAIRPTRPSSWTFALDSSNIPTIFFDRANTTGGQISYLIDYQRTVVDLADSGASFSLLPDGYEVAVLLEDAEARAMQYLRRAGWEQKRALIDKYIANEFFSFQRSSKEQTMPDQDVARRAEIDSIDNAE